MQASRTEPIRVLHLEDNDLDADLIARHLALIGLPFEIVRAVGRTDFSAALAANAVDLVLADYALPGYDGLAALALARRAQPEVPFIFVSGVMDEGRAVESLRDGATDYVLKRHLERLEPAVRRALREAEDRAERRASTVRTEQLQSLAAALASATGAVDVATVAVRHGVAALGAAKGACWRPARDERSLEMVAELGYTPGMRSRFVRVDLAGDVPVAVALRRNEPVWVESRGQYQQDFPAIAAWSEDHAKELAFVCLPLVTEGRALGVLTFRFDQVRRFGPVERALLAAVARLVTQALDRARLYEAERAARDDLALLSQASAVLASSLDHETTMRNIVRLATERLGDFGFLDMREDDGSVRRAAHALEPVTLARVASAPWVSVAAEHSEVCALLSGEPAIFPDITDAWLREVAVGSEHRALLLALAPRSMITVPLRSRGGTLGSLTLFFAASGRRHTADDLALAGEIAQRAAAAMDNARLFRAARRAEDHARQEERRVRLALDAGRMGAWDWDVATNSVRWSEAVEAMYGVAPGGFGGTLAEYAAHIHPADRAGVLGAVDRAVATKTDLHVEHRVVWPDGTVRWIEGRGSPIVGPDGALTQLLGVCTDVTARKDAELRLRQREASLRFLSEASAALAGSLDDPSTLSRVVDLAVPTLADCAVLDLVAPDGTLRRTAVAHVDAAKGEAVWELGRRYPPGPEEPSVIGRALRTRGAAWVTEVTDALVAGLVDEGQRELVRRAGLRSFLSIPLESRGRAVGVFTIAITESDRRFGENDAGLTTEVARRIGVALENAALYREAREASRLKDDFLATVSHELRTPMTAILGWTTMLPARMGDPAALKRGLEVIERNARAQARLIEDVLDVSRIVSGKLRLERAPVDLGRVARAAVEGLLPRAASSGVEITLELDELGVIPGDADRLQQVVWNLALNAVKFTPREGRVTVTGGRSAEGVWLRVADTGQGIAPEFLPHVFERFRQADSTSTRLHGGLGLGLEITRHLVELHGGTVRAESPGVGLGATFTVTLPVDEVASPIAAAVSSRPPPMPPDEAALAGLRVLVCDDARDARDIVAEILQRSGAVVETVGSAAEAIASFDRAPPDVLVSDIGMPGEDGHALLRRVRVRSAEAGGRTPAAALTAYAQVEDARQSEAAGFQVHLTKPVEPARLVAAVARLGGRTREG